MSKKTNTQIAIHPAVNRFLAVDPAPPLCICPRCNAVVDPLANSAEGQTDEQRLIEGLKSWPKAKLQEALNKLPAAPEYTLARGIILGLLSAA